MTESAMKMLNPAGPRVLKRLHYPLDVILTCMRCYEAYPLRLWHLDDMMAERGVSVDHSTVHGWAVKLLPVLKKAFRLRRRPVGKSWHMDETHSRVKGEWRYLYRPIDRDSTPETVTLDTSGTNLDAINADRETPVRIRQSKYLNHLVEHDHRAIKRRTRPMLGLKTFRCARILLAGVELMHIIANGQMKCARTIHPFAADQFYDLAK